MAEAGAASPEMGQRRGSHGWPFEHSRLGKLVKLGLEGRWVAELGAHYGARDWLRGLPKGDGHPVIVFPGFLTTQFSTRPLRRFLTDLDYKVFDWGFGRNLRYSPELEEQMQAMVEARVKESGQKVSLLGWSLGGVFAREIARHRPELVRNVISLGSPITGTRHVTLAGPIYEFLNGEINAELLERIERMRVPPQVPSSVLYSRTDGVVHWHGAQQHHGDLSENIRVPASHLGMGANPAVLYVIADRLRQKADGWKPFEAKGIGKMLFRGLQSPD